MSSSPQFPLPGFPVRVVVSATWERGSTPCTVRATVDSPSDQYTSMMAGVDVEARLTFGELYDTMCTALYQAMLKVEQLNEPTLMFGD